MTHNEQRKYLIDRLLEEDRRYKRITVPESEKEQKDLLRSLMNVRSPKPVSYTHLDVYKRQADGGNAPESRGAELSWS